ncbi:MAG: flavodoxin family protein [bacterium]|nr:flavodoxin family protein [bacterium]
MQILVIFSTEVGTTKIVAQTLQKLLSAKDNTVVLYEVGKERTPPNVLGTDLVLIGSPTYYNGELESKMAEFLSDYAPNLAPYKVAVFSLGDTAYEHFCGSAELLESWVTEHGGKLTVPTLQIDGYPDDQQINEWVELI